jgi:hypothetical protein
VGKYGSVPAIPVTGPYVTEPNPYLTVQKKGTEYVAVVVKDWWPNTTTPPAYTIVADEGTPQQVTLPATLSPGQHSLVAKSSMVGSAIVIKA